MSDAPDILTGMTTNPDRPATQPQKDLLVKLAGERMFFGEGVPRDGAILMMQARVAEPMTSVDASDMIDRLFVAPKFPEDAIPAKPATLRSLRAWAQEKALWGLGVPKDETIARVEAMISAGLNDANARGMVRDAFRAKPHPSEKSPLPLHVIEGIDGIEVHEGHYAVLVQDVLRFYRIYTPNSGEWQGVPVIRRYASQNMLAITPSEAKVALHLVEADRDNAAFRFSDEFTRCNVCGLQLTDQISRLISVGPTCRGFTNHQGLRDAAADVDRNPARRHVYRALRGWAIEQGFNDPRDKNERESLAGSMTASRLASAWSGLPGLLALPLDEAVTRCKNALTGDLHPDLEQALLAAPADTLLILIESKVLSAPVLITLSDHKSKRFGKRQPCSWRACSPSDLRVRALRGEVEAPGFRLSSHV